MRPSFIPGSFTIGARLALGFGVVLALLSLLTVVGVSRVGKINESLAAISDLNGVKERYAINFRGSVHDRAIAIRDVVLEDRPEAVQEQLALIDKLAANYARSATPLDSLFARADITAEERSALAEINAVQARTLPMAAEVIKMRLAGDRAGATQLLLTQARPAFAQWLKSINVLIDLEEKMNQSESASARSVAGSFRTLMLALCGFAIVLGGGIALIIYRSIVGPIRQASAVAKSVANGDLSAVIGKGSGDETGSLLNSLREMRDSLLLVVSEVRSSALGIATVSAEISSGNSNLSMRTEKQSSAIEQTSSSMEQLSATVLQNAENARRANQMAKSASELAVRGGEGVGEVVKTMRGINDSSRRIADIIAVIDSIAFQTNILALNAAVEAARAGAQGRGFAVVATEVRSLASRSADAAKEIKSLISDSVSRVEQGTALVDRAGTTMSELVASIRRVTDIMGEITTASSEQSDGVAHVGESIGQIDQATQQNAALVEESSAAASTLNDQAQQLVKAVAVFKLA